MQKQVQSLLSVRTSVQCLRGVDVLSMVPAEVIDELRQRDPHPYLRAYSICHEGVSKPRLLGEADKPIRWTRAAVQSMRNMVRKGLKFFLGHNEDSSTEGRPDLGEVVWDGERMIDGVLHHVVVGYFPSRERVQALDVCSHEGLWDTFVQAGEWVADKLHELTGIALTSSDQDTPAFPGARCLAAVQAYDGDYDEGASRQNIQDKKRRKGMSDVDVTALSHGDLIKEVQRRRLLPSELFDEQAMRSDRSFAKLFADEEARSKKLKEQEALVAKLQGDVKERDGLITVSTARARFDKMLGEMKLTPRQKAWVNERFPKKLESASDEALKALIDERLSDYAAAVKTLGFKEDTAQPAGKKAGVKLERDEDEELVTEGKPADEVSEDADLTKAANNALLKEDADLE